MPPMARTNRNSSGGDDGAAAPSVDAAALDNLDLDDMFADDNDMLFEELDIDLDGMGDIVNKSSAPAAPSIPAPASATPSAPKRKGPKTKRPPPAEPPATTKTKKVDKDLDTSLTILPKRRKTKRKTKSPTFWDDGDYVEEPKSKKRRGGAASSTAASVASTSSAKSGASKKGSTTTSKSKKKKGAATTSEDTIKSTATSPKKSKVKGGPTSPTAVASSIPPPVARGSSVAAAGQFGGRIKRGVAAGLPLHKTGTSKSKRKSSSSAASAGSSGPTPPPSKIRRGDSVSSQTPSVQSKADSTASVSSVTATASNAPILPPKPEPTYCGIKPSRTMFYPFMEALPSEAALKNRKVYPLMDRISSNFASKLNSSNPSPGGGTGSVTASSGTSSSTPSSSNASAKGSGAKSVGSSASSSGNQENANDNDELAVPESHPIYKLIIETYELNDKDKAAFGQEKRVALGHAIGQIRSVIGKLEKPRLVADLYRICGLLRRQYSFLKQNLQNMEYWCKDNFSPTDYQATYGPPAAATPTSSTGTPVSTGGRIIGVPTNIIMKKSALTGLKTRLLKIKVKCSGFKEPKTSLVAKLPPSISTLPAPPSSKTSKAKEASVKTRKESAASAKPSATAAAPSASLSPSSQQTAKEKESRVVRRPPTYAHARPEIRRQRLSDQILAWATHLETKHTQMTDFRSRQIGKRAHEVRKLVHVDNDDPELLPPLHTQLMWKALDTAGYLGSPATHWGLPPSATNVISTGSVGSSTAVVAGAASSLGSSGVNTSSLIATNSSGTATANAGSMRKRNVNDRVFEDWLNVAWCPEMNPRWYLQQAPREIKGVSVVSSSQPPGHVPGAQKSEQTVHEKSNEGRSSIEITSVAHGDAKEEQMEEELILPSPAIADSLFNRLQSLLVEEEDSDMEEDDESVYSDSDGETDDEDQSDAVMEDISADDLDAGDGVHQRRNEDDLDDGDLAIVRSTGFNAATFTKKGVRVANLSALSVEERAYLHLCSVGLVRKPLFPAVEFNRIGISSHFKNGIKVEDTSEKPGQQERLTESTDKNEEAEKDDTPDAVNPSQTPNRTETSTTGGAKIGDNGSGPHKGSSSTPLDVESTTKKGNQEVVAPKPSNCDEKPGSDNIAAGEMDVDGSPTPDRSDRTNPTVAPNDDQKLEGTTGTIEPGNDSGADAEPKDSSDLKVPPEKTPDSNDKSDKKGPPLDSSSAPSAKSDKSNTESEKSNETSDPKGPSRAPTSATLDTEDSSSPVHTEQVTSDNPDAIVAEDTEVASVSAADDSAENAKEAKKNADGVQTEDGKDVSMPDVSGGEEEAKTKVVQVAADNSESGDHKDVSMVEVDIGQRGAKEGEENAGQSQPGLAQDVDIDHGSEHGDGSVTARSANLEDEYEHIVEDEMSYVIYAMGSELSRLSKTNNARVAFLQNSARVLAVQSQCEKMLQEEQSSLVSKCQALLKRSKEHKAKSARLKQQQQSQNSSSSSNNKSKEELKLPW